MVEEKITFIVQDTSNERIDIRLSKHFPYTRNFFQHIIARGGVIVNNVKVKKSYKVRMHDVVVIDKLSRFLSAELLEEAPIIQLPIIHEKEDYLVIYKPKGILSHPTSIWEIQQASVVGFIYHTYKHVPSMSNFIRAGLLHRLDKDTNGLMIIAKTEKGLAYFRALFQQKSLAQTIAEKESVPLHKYYQARCQVTEKGKEFIKNISQYPIYIQQTVLAKVPHTTPKLGITKILDIRHESEHIIRIYMEILTGRTHQIRYHLSHVGLPIVGDYMYGKQQNRTTDVLQLSAHKLEFIDCYGNKVCCTIPDYIV